MKKKEISVRPDVFQAMQNIDIKSLEKFESQFLRPVLPCLVRTALCASVDKSQSWTKARKDVLKILAGIEDVNSIVALLSIDFHALEQDVKKEQQLRSKVGSSHTDSVLISQLQNGLALEFEHSDPARRIRLLLSELLFILSQVRENKIDLSQKQWELFDCEVYLEEVSDVLCIAYSELPSLLPISDVAEALMYVPNGAWLLCRLVANSPDSFREVCQSLVSKGEKQDEETIGGRKRMDLIQTLCEMNPCEALFVRSVCVQNCTMPGLTVALTLNTFSQSAMLSSDANQSQTSKDSANDLVAFVSGLLLGNNIEVKNWFSQFIKCGQRRGREPSSSMLHTMRQCLIQELVSILPVPGQTIDEGHVIKAGSFIRLFCALKGMATLKFTDEEMKLLLRLVTSQPPISQSGARFVSLGLCMLIACPYIIGSQEQEKQVAEWIRWLIASENLFQQKAGKSSSFGEMLFLIAIHFHGNHMHAISELVCSTLGMKTHVKANALARIRQIFTQDIFTEQVITSHAVTVPVTNDLNGNMAGYLPIHCIYQLLKSRAFSKYKVPIKDWIYSQISHCSYPLHPLLPSLLEVFVNSILVKSAKTDHTNQPIETQEIVQLFSEKPVFQKCTNGEVNLTPHLCMLYYVLLYQDTLDSQRKTLLLSGRTIESYPDSLMSTIPINYLIQQSQKRQELYGGLFSSLLKLLVSQFPHLCIIEDWLDESMTPSQSTRHLTCGKANCTVDNFRKALTTLPDCATDMLIVLQRMLSLPVEELLPFTDELVNCLPLILSSSVPRKVIDLVKKIWFRIHSLTPRSLRLATVNALRPQRKNQFKFSLYTETDVTVDPLIVLRCDERVFRCAPLLEIVLRILSAYTLACRVYMENHIQSNPVLDGNNQTDQDRQELKGALLAAQESAVIQILLEYCIGNDDEKQEGSGMLNNLQEVRSIICSYIHQTFISDPNLAKLVHFQGYPTELLPVTVLGIPSMHICLDYIPEMLSQPQMDKQIFAIKLTSHLCCQYALPKSLSIAKLCINVMFAMIGVLDAKKRVEFFRQTLPYLVKICQAFPPLCEDVTSLLIQIGRVCLSHLTCTSNIPESDFTSDQCCRVEDHEGEPARKRLKVQHELSATYHKLYGVIQTTFKAIVTKSVATKDVY